MLQNINLPFGQFIWFICRFNLFWFFFFYRNEWRDQGNSQKDRALSTLGWYN